MRHALNATSWSMGWLEEETPQPALFFVHDQGVYVMSNGQPADLVEDPQYGGQRNYVAYAEGCNPNIGEFDDWYGTSRDLVGGDDFAETLVLDQECLSLCEQYEEMHITLEGSSLRWEFVNPKRAAPAAV
jgi:hypothetical protein